MASRRPRRSGTTHDLGSWPTPGLPDRRVRVHVPPGVDPSMPRPALYLFDGQNVLDDHGSFAGGWHAHAAADRLVAGKTFIAPIVVAIDHGNASRIDELSAWRMRDMGGHAEPFLEWVTGTLGPELQKRFPLQTGALGAVAGGSSMGGLCAMWAHFRHPEFFGGAIAMSPSFWFGRRALAGWLRDQPTPRFSRVYLDCGVREGGGRMFGTVEEVAQHLASRGYAKRQLMWRPDARGQHSESHWRRRLPKAMRFMFRL